MSQAQSPAAGFFLPTATIRSDQRQIWIVGCHGGAGTTTLSRALHGGADAGRYWPVPEPSADEKSKVVLVARSNVSGLRSAQRALEQWALGDFGDRVQVLGLAVIADAPGRMPRQLRELLDLVADAAPALWVLPWVEALRTDDDLNIDSAPSTYRKLVDELSELVMNGWVDTLRTVAAEDP